MGLNNCRKVSQGNKGGRTWFASRWTNIVGSNWKSSDWTQSKAAQMLAVSDGPGPLRTASRHRFATCSAALTRSAPSFESMLSFDNKSVNKSDQRPLNTRTYGHTGSDSSMLRHAVDRIRPRVLVPRLCCERAPSFALQSICSGKSCMQPMPQCSPTPRLNRIHGR